MSATDKSKTTYLLDTMLINLVDRQAFFIDSDLIDGEVREVLIAGVVQEDNEYHFLLENVQKELSSQKLIDTLNSSLENLSLRWTLMKVQDSFDENGVPFNEFIADSVFSSNVSKISIEELMNEEKNMEVRLIIKCD